MKTKLKPKHFAILFLGMGIVFIGALAKIMKEDFAGNILTIGLIIEVVGVFIFVKMHFKVQKELRNNNMS